jgi:hypothetical protein
MERLAAQGLQHYRLEHPGEYIGDDLLLSVPFGPNPNFIRPGRKGEHAHARPLNPLNTLRRIRPSENVVTLITPFTDFATYPGSWSRATRKD